MSSGPISVLHYIELQYHNMYHKIVKHVIWLDQKIEINMILNLIYI
jgi:hypothetical protein